MMKARKPPLANGFMSTVRIYVVIKCKCCRYEQWDEVTLGSVGIRSLFCMLSSVWTHRRTSGLHSASRNMLHLVAVNGISCDFLDCCISCLLLIFRQATSVCCITANQPDGWWFSCHNKSSKRVLWFSQCHASLFIISFSIIRVFFHRLPLCL